MTEPTAGGAPGSTIQCPWCSAVVPVDSQRCPSCGAAIHEAADGDAAIPGVTQVDPSLALRREPPRASRIVGWISGEVDVDPAPLTPPTPLGPAGTGAGSAAVANLDPAGPDSFAPPSADVRREMARLELEAIRAQLEARAPEAEPPADGSPSEAMPAAAAGPDANETPTSSADPAAADRPEPDGDAAPA